MKSVKLYRERNSFHVDRAGARYRAVRGAALLDVKPHRFEDARSGFVDRFAKAIHARKILAVGVILAAFAFDGNRIGVQLHAPHVPMLAQLGHR